MASVKSGLTAKDLLRLPDDGKKYELIKGELRVVPAGMQHEKIGARLVTFLMNHLTQHPVGEVYGSSAGYKLPNGDVRSPDVSFVRNEKLPGGKTPVGFAEFPPDLAVEILSPTDYPRDVSEKLGEYLGWSVPVVWLVDPEARTVTVYRSLTDVKVFRSQDLLTAEEILPGFTVNVSYLFT